MLASEAVRRARLRLAAGLRTIVHSGLDDPDNLAYLDLRELCHSFLPNVEAELRKLEGQASASLLSPERVAELRGLSAAGRAAESDVTRFEWTAPTGAGGDLQRTSEIECMQLEGCWVEGNLVAIVPAWLAAVDRELALWTAAPGSKEAMYARGMLEALDSGLGELERAAQDPIGFDAALDALMGALVSRAVRHKVSGPFD